MYSASKINATCHKDIAETPSVFTVQLSLPVEFIAVQALRKHGAEGHKCTWIDIDRYELLTASYLPIKEKTGKTMPGTECKERDGKDVTESGMRSSDIWIQGMKLCPEWVIPASNRYPRSL